MRFNDLTFQSIRLLLLPFALVYGVVVRVRNALYDKRILRGVAFNLPIICIGNLSVGGTGKSPMTEYLLRVLKDRYRAATLSRGYKRKTKGYTLAVPGTTALEIGDEPMQFHLKFPTVSVAVGEERIVAIPQLLQDRPETQVILMDDAFQHRSVQAGLNILLTDYQNLFTRDFYLPTGELRDWKGSYRRAQLIVVTKCPDSLDRDQARKISREIHPGAGQQVFFSTLEYGTPYHIVRNVPYALRPELEVLLVCGIANPLPLKNFLADSVQSFDLMSFRDHHIFTIDDLQAIRTRFEAREGDRKIILTTEKDAVRLQKFGTALDELPLYALPVRHRFLLDGADTFQKAIFNFIDDFNYG